MVKSMLCPDGEGYLHFNHIAVLPGPAQGTIGSKICFSAGINASINGDLEALTNPPGTAREYHSTREPSYP